MPNYTYLNEVPAPRIHKKNAKATEAESEEYIIEAERSLLMIAASHPTNDDLPSVRLEVETHIETILNSAVKAFLARYIIENPDLCIDDLEAND